MSILTTLIHKDRQIPRFFAQSKLRSRTLFIRWSQIVAIALIFSTSLLGEVPSVNASTGLSSIDTSSTGNGSKHAEFIPLQAESCPTGGDLIVGDGETCSWSPGTHSYDSITVESGGTILFEGDTATNTGVNIEVGAVIIESGGAILGDGQGYPFGEGPGAGGEDSRTGGGGHGGYGGWGARAGATGGNAYGSVFQPTTLGSGAGNSSSSGAGAGAIHLIVNDSLVIDGSLTANGDPSTGPASGGGAGGSIWIESSILSGSGSIHANGGIAGREGGGGGGGRIAIYADANTYAGTVQTYGGTGYQHGGPGTIYWAAEDRLYIDNASNYGRNAVLIEDHYAFNRIDLFNAGFLEIQGLNSSLNLEDGTVAGDGTGTLKSFGTINTPAIYTINAFTLDVAGQLTAAEEINLSTAGGLILHADSPFYNGGYTFTSILVEDGGTLKLKPYNEGGSNYVNDHGVTLMLEDLTIHPGGVVTASGLGYGIGAGPGAGGVSSERTGGGGHGGYGGRSSRSSGGDAYGSVFQPETLGSGAGNFSGSGAGAGAIHLIVSDDLVIDGSLTANGDPGTYTLRGGGAGGSIWIEAESFSGSGAIQANGGNGGSEGGGGGGGRIAINVDSNVYAGTVQAHGGTGYQPGGPGTTYWAAEDRLYIDNAGNYGPAALLLEDNYTFNRIELFNAGFLEIQGINSSVTLENDTVTGDGTGTLKPFGVINTPMVYTINAFTLDVEGQLTAVEEINLSASGGLILHADSPFYEEGFTFTSILVEDSSTLELVPYVSGSSDYTKDHGLTLILEDLTIEPGGLVTANGLGYRRGQGPGAGGVYSSWTGGGGHGGYGGRGSNADATGGDAYGSVFEPITMGSGAGNNNNSGTGGGAIHFIVSDALAIDGSLTANGDPGTLTQRGGGAGGSIWIETASLSGSGSIQANGGNGGGEGGGGGGGRIAIHADANAYTGTVQAYGGTGYQTGGPGTVYWSAENHLMVNNNGKSGRTATLEVGEYTLDLIHLSGNGHLDLRETSSSLTCDNIQGDGTSTLSIYGTYHVPTSLSIGGYHLNILGLLYGAEDLTLQNGGMLTLRASTPLYSDPFQFGSITLLDNSLLRLIPLNNGDSDYTNDAPFVLTVDTVSVETGSRITSDGNGYPGGYESGKGPGAGTGPSGWLGYERGGGGGYGGKGGTTDQHPGGQTYGDVYEPTDLGSGGGGGLVVTTKYYGGNGGGAIRLIVNNTLHLDGEISADGLLGPGYCCPANGGAGGGSGGSIWITSPSITGSGTIHSNGGRSQYGGGGGGGRISIDIENLDPAIHYSYAGGSGKPSGDPGSLYLGELDPNQSTVTVDPATVPTDGISQGTITVTARNTDGIPLPGVHVEVALASGDDALINGQLVTLDEFVTIGTTNSSGTVTANIRAGTTGTRTILAKGGQIIITGRGTVEFIPGPVDVTNSSIEADPSRAPADGSSLATIIVTLRDAFSNRIPDKSVTLSSTGSAVLTQPTEPTDSLGQTNGTVSDAVIEVVTISAEVEGVTLNDTATVHFRGADLAVTLNAPSEVPAGGILVYDIKLENRDLLTAQDVTLSQELPPDVNFIDHTAPVEPTQAGDTLTWSFGTLAYAQPIRFTVTAEVPQSVAYGSSLTSTLTSTTSTVDMDPSNNTASDTTTVVDPRDFQASLTPPSTTLSLGGVATYTIRIQNSGWLADTYTLSLTGLDPSWVSFSRADVSLSPGDFTEVTLTVQPPGCQAETTLPFTVAVESVGKAETINLEGQLILTLSPQITLESPAQNAISGARTVLFQWRTVPATTGLLTLYPSGDPDDAQTFDTPEGSLHMLQVEDLTRDVSYEWHVEATSACGVATSPTRSFTVGSGIVFADRNPTFTIDRDYQQIVKITVRNDDIASHELLATVQNPFHDLIINFVGSGSVDQVITLEPGESKTLDLVVHAQDALEREYDLLAVITADEGTGTPLKDTASIHLRVLAEADLEVTEVSVDPITGTRTMRVTNLGKTVSDLNITAVDPNTGEPARVYLKPNISHARLRTDQSITFQMIPLFDERDVGTTTASTFSLKPWLQTGTPGQIDAELQVSAAGTTKPVSANLSCASGSVYKVDVDDVCMPIHADDWYCTNKPEISTPLETPHFILQEGVSSVDLQMSIAPRGTVRPHTTSFSLNGTHVGTLENMVPDGVYSSRVPTSALNYGVAGPVVQRLDLSSQHPNGGHYVVASNFTLGVGMESVTGYVCASSQAEAQQAFEDVYGLEPLGSSEYCSSRGINPETTLSNSPDMCTNMGASATLWGGKPINTNTGGVDYSYTDLSIPTSAGPLTFQRWYASLSTEEYTDALGFGWTHSLDTRLIFPDDPLGRDGSVLFKVQSANRYEFFINPDGTYSAYPGVCGSLTRDEGPPITYTYSDNAQNVFTFNEAGLLTTLSDPQGRALHYLYDDDGHLTKVEDDSGQRFLSLSYDSEGRIESVSDHSGRTVSFAYDPTTGDLISATDTLGQDWIYRYDPDHPHLLAEVIDPRGVTIERTEYDARGRAVRQFDGEGQLVVELAYHGFGTTVVYDARGNQEEHTYNGENALERQADALGGHMSREYDENFRITSMTDPAGASTNLEWSEDGANLTLVRDAEGHETELSYDDLNNLTRIVDPRGFITTYTYDGTLLTESTDPLGNTTTYTYTSEGYLDSVTDPAGNTTSYTYDEHGQRISMTDALGNVTRYRYDDLGRLVEIEDALGKITRNEYDDAGRIVRTIRNYDPSRPQNDENQYNIISEYIYDEVGNQIAVVDSLGRQSEFEYDGEGRLVRTIDPDGNASTNIYDPAGNLATTTDALSRTISLAYDALNRMIATTDPLGNRGTTTYNADGTVASTKDALDRITRYIYDDLKRPVKVIDPLGNETTTEYDESGNVTATTDADGNTTRYEYDALNRLVRQIDPLGGVTTHVYDAVGNRIQTTDPNGNTTSYEYDALNRMIAVIDALGNTTTYAYDALGNQISMTDANGHTTTYSYDALNRLVTTTDPLGNVSNTIYDPLGKVIARTDPNGNITIFEYDDLDRLIQLVDALGGETIYTYDAVGNQLTYTDANGHTTTTTYDALNRPLSVTDPNGNTSTTEYDPVGNVIASTNALGNSITFSYDALNRQITATDPIGNSTTYAYDALGNRVSMLDALGVATRYEYDALSRLTAVVENHRPGFLADHETNVRTEYTYDPVGNRLTLRDGNGNVTTFTYDALNRLVSESDPLGNTTSYAYDAMGNRSALTDAMGFTTTFLHDPGDRLVTINYPDPDADVTFNYDPAGNRTSMVDGVGTTTWTYDALYRATVITDPFGGTVGYAYDAVGNRTGLTYPDSKVVSYAYDSGNRMTQVADWDANVTSYQYDAADQLLTTLLPNGVTSSYSYDEAGQLLLLKHESEIELLSSFEYTYDAVGNRTQVVETMLWPWQPTSNVPASTGTSLPEPAPAGQMAADPLMVMMAPLVLLVALSSRLLKRGKEVPKGILILVLIAGLGAGISACIPIPTLPPFPTRTPRVTSTPTTTPTFTPSPVPSDTPTPSPTPEPIPVVFTTTIDYAYDPLYRLTAADYDSGESFHYIYDPVGNRLRQETHKITNLYAYDASNRMVDVDGVPYVWDANGNLLSDGTRTFAYDHANRFIALSDQGSAYIYAYNGLGDRLQQTVDSTTTNYSLDLNTGLTQVLSDSSNDYLYGLTRVGEQQSSNWIYHLPDALNSVRQIVDPSATVGISQSYDPFGGLLASAGDLSSSFGFTGEQHEPIGLVFLRARYYDPSTGRFIQRDPLRGISTLPQTQNPYTYVVNNPVLLTDPSGEIAPIIIALVVGIPVIAGVASAAWDVFITQGTGLGGENQFRFGCVDWGHVFKAGGATTAGAIVSLAGIPLSPVYLGTSLFGMSPEDTNWAIFSLFGLGDDYRRWMTNPYFVAGRGGGTAGSLYLSARMLATGLLRSSISISGGRALAAETGFGQLKVLASGGLPSLQVSLAQQAAFGGILVVENTRVVSSLISAITSGGGGSSGIKNQPYSSYAERENLAQRAENELGGIKKPAQGDGWRITIPEAARGKRNIVVRIMNSGGIKTEPYFRVSVEGKGSFTLDGSWSNDPSLTHHSFTSDSFDIIKQLIQLAKVK